MANENETIEQIADEIKNLVSVYGVKAFGPHIYAYTRGKLEDRLIAANKRELAAKDELIKELADALDRNASLVCGYKSCEKCKSNLECNIYALIAKAREVIK